MREGVLVFLIKMFNIFTYQKRLKEIEESKPKEDTEI